MTTQPVAAPNADTSCSTGRASGSAPATTSTISPFCWFGSLATQSRSVASGARRRVSKVLVSSRHSVA